VEPPAVRVPLGAALAFARLVEGLPGEPVVTAAEVRAGGQWWAFSSARAKRELGYSPGHHEETLVRTIEWYRERDSRLAAPGRRQALALRLAGFTLRRTAGALRGLGVEIG
jgi:dihydroflavonol-4-reductase